MADISIARKREAIYEAYRSRNWAIKVGKMSDEQVIAIYLRLKSQGKVN